MDIISAKNALRLKMKKLRAGIAPEEKKNLDRKMQKNLFECEIYKRSDVLLTFISVGDEPDTRMIIETACRDGKIVAVPKCLPERKMDFFIIKGTDDCERGAYGIPEPKTYCQRADTDSGNILCLVPGLAFDRQGIRLGYGGGYYDRFLAAHANIFTMGYCTERLITEKVPKEDTDIRLMGLITEKAVEVLYEK